MSHGGLMVDLGINFRHGFNAHSLHLACKKACDRRTGKGPQHFTGTRTLRCARGRGRTNVSVVSQLKDVSPTGQNMDKVQRVIGMANSQDKKTRFGPAPPSDREAGSGFINLTGREDLLTGQREFNKAKRDKREEENSTPVLASAFQEESVSDRATDKEVPGGSDEGVDVARRGGGYVFLPTPLTAGQRIVALGMLGLTAVAFGRSSQEALPADVLDFLQLWMRIAWAGHAGLGVIAAAIASGKGQPPQKWFFKVLCTGALGLQEILAM